MSLEKWSIEEGWILCKMDGLQCSLNCPQFKRGTTSELGYNDSQKKLGNFSLPFVVRLKPVEIANYYCPEKQTKQGVAGYRCASG